jgi:hypothetical protein
MADGPIRAAGGKRSAVAVEKLDPGGYARWAEFVRSCSGGSAYALPEYVAALCDAAGGSYVVLAALRGDEIVGGVTVLERRRRIIGLSVAPRLLHYYNGFVLADYQTRYPSERTSRRFEVVTALAETLETRGYGRLEFRHRPDIDDVRTLQARDWSAWPSYSYVVPLDDLEEQWQRVEQNLRRLVERARREGLRFDPDCAPDDLFRLHHETHVRKGAPLYLPAGRFQAFVTRLIELDLGRVYAARLADGRVAAAQLVLVGHRHTHTAIAAADGDLQQTGANPFLRWSAFEHLAASGAESNDLTDAAPSPVERFKAQLGGRLALGFVTQRLSSVYRIQLGAYHELRRARIRLQRRA